MCIYMCTLSDQEIMPAFSAQCRWSLIYITCTGGLHNLLIIEHIVWHAWYVTRAGRPAAALGLILDHFQTDVITYKSVPSDWFVTKTGHARHTSEDNII